jgi:pimeloyl-ACP methyl ester carboxylesterase
MIDIRAEKRPLDRPLIIVGGFLNPNFSTMYFATYFQRITCDSRVIPVSLGTCTSFEECRQRIIAAVDQTCPNDDPNWTASVDVIGLSLGGLAARYAAAPSRDATHARRLRIARLFTISSPHTGATLAATISLIQFHRDMRPGSEFLQWVASADTSAAYELYPYVHLNDDIVGEHNAAPPGVNPWWLPNSPPISPHLSAMLDERILADISRRLRNEQPFTRAPAQALPAP